MCCILVLPLFKRKRRYCEALVKQATTTTLQGCCAPTIPTGIRETGIHGSEKRPLPIDSKKKYLNENSLKQAIKFISTPPFCLFDCPSNQVMIFDEQNENQIVGLLKFIPFSSMTP
ncbi:hypothetical protein VP01_7704g1 [Puccinia sorghi]|uniref:Uncharacterized protein n=1 Tax=Puccinia sorghi TaxID=27349 RepID=A0A0L6UBM2_9BASI|nr:hypothetical protein VP01_7704g1 [Puccinia sorghi]